MSEIEKRLRASVKYGAVHGNREERKVCERQMLEAADEIERLRATAALAEDVVDRQKADNKRLRAKIDRAYQMLTINGVSRERAKSLSNGIDVLVTRMAKEICFLTAEKERYRKALEFYARLQEGDVQHHDGGEMTDPAQFARKALEER